MPSPQYFAHCIIYGYQLSLIQLLVFSFCLHDAVYVALLPIVMYMHVRLFIYELDYHRVRL